MFPKSEIATKHNFNITQTPLNLDPKIIRAKTQADLSKSRRSKTKAQEIEFFFFSCKENIEYKKIRNLEYM